MTRQGLEVVIVLGCWVRHHGRKMLSCYAQNAMCGVQSLTRALSKESPPPFALTPNRF